MPAYCRHAARRCEWLPQSGSERLPAAQLNKAVALRGLPPLTLLLMPVIAFLKPATIPPHDENVCTGPTTRLCDPVRGPLLKVPERAEVSSYPMIRLPRPVSVSLGVPLASPKKLTPKAACVVLSSVNPEPLRMWTLAPSKITCGPVSPLIDPVSTTFT